MDRVTNFAKVNVNAGYDNAATTIVLSPGHGARLPAAPFNATWWNVTTYADPTDDPEVEIVRVTVVATDTLTITRAQEGTAASLKNTLGKTYRMIVGLTAKVLNTDIQAICNPVTVVYASKIPGINLNGSLTANTGTDDKALIQAVLNTATTTTPLRLIMDGVALIDTTTTGLVVKGNTEITGMGYNTGFSWKGSAAALQRVLFSNANPIGTGAVTDKNIIMRNFAINGNRASGHGGSGFYALLANSAGIFLACIRFVGVANLLIEDYLTMGSPGYSIHIANATNFHVNRARFQNANGELGTDGVHVNGPASNFSIKNISGTTGDDLIALNADDGHLPGSTGNIGVFGDNSLASTVKSGAISRCIVDGVYPEGCLSAFRLLSAVSPLDCVVRNVQGSIYTRICYIDNDPTEIASLGSGAFGTLILENINVSNSNTSASSSLELGAIIQYLKLGIISDNLNTTGPTITTTALMSIKELELDAVVTSVAILPSPLMTVSSGAISTFSLKGRFDAGTGSAQAANPILVVSGGSIDTLHIAMVADRMNNLVSFTTATTTDTVVLGPGRHLRAGASNGTIKIAAGIHITNVVQACFATKLLNSGAGTITNLYEGNSSDSVSDPGSTTLANNLVAFWHMTEAGSASRLDSSGNAHTLANNGAVSQSSGAPQAGNVATFPGTLADYLDTAGASFTVSGATGATFSCWIRMFNTTANHIFFSKALGAGVYEMVLYWDNGANVFAVGMNGQHVNSSTAGLVAAVWYFVSGGWDPVSGKLFLSVNNVADVLSSAVSVVADTGAPLRVGKSLLDSLTCKGDMGHMGWWSRVLTGAERTTLYNANTFYDVL